MKWARVSLNSARYLSNRWGPPHIANKNAITYKEIFPLIENNRLWMGVTPMGTDMLFDVPPKIAKTMLKSGKKGSNYKIVNGKVMGRSASVWFTNLDHGRRHQMLPLMTLADNLRFSRHKELKGKAAYDRYDNFNAIEVPFTDAIPSDYEGVMGVPVTFLDKYNPDQFEIVGNSDDSDMMSEIGVQALGREFISAYRARGGTGHYSPGMRMLGLLEPQPRVIFKRILIRHVAVLGRP